MESPRKDLNVFHFSHPHALQLTTSTSTSIYTCTGCKLNINSGSTYYGCKSCNFCLHYFCYKLPIITHHPSHSSHDLVLLIIRQSPAAAAGGAVKCLACGLHVTAFCYHCAECGIYFHTFCLALPLSISISHHPHKLKLEFSPPYDFFCDMCKKTSYNGWLYRCNSCEFDMHLACAVQNLEPQSLHHPSFSQSNNLLRKTGSPQVTRIKSNNGGDQDNNSIGSEILHLMVQQIGGEIRGNNNGGKVIGWDKRVSSPRQSRVASNELQLTELSNPAGESGNLQGRTPLQDKLTPRSDVSTPPSYQFSEACFSIDLAKSYALAESKGSGKMASDSGEVKEPLVFVNWPSFNSYNAAHQPGRLKTSFLNGGRTSSFAEPNQKAVRHKPSKSDSESYGKDKSCWKKFASCCI